MIDQSMRSYPLLAATVALAALWQASAASAQLVSTGAESSTMLSCFYECKPGPDIQGEPTYRAITTLLLVNNGEFEENVDVNFIDGNSNVIATTDVHLAGSDLDELAVCATIESITGSPPPKAGIIQIGNYDDFLDQQTSGVFSWVKSVSGKFFASKPEPFDGRVVGIAKTECKYVAVPEVSSPPRIDAAGQAAPNGPPILVEDTDEPPPAQLADLIPVPDVNSGSFCRLIRGVELEVEIANSGTAAAAATTTEVVFDTGAGPVSQAIATPPLAPGASTSTSLAIPAACYGVTSNCSFSIEADRSNVENESNETNNFVNDLCLG